MKHTIYSADIVARVVGELGIQRLENATIGEVVLLARRLEELTGIPFIRMDQGVPGLPPCRVGTEAEKVALDTHVPAVYPAAEGVPELKQEASRFVKAFLDVDVAAAGCVPVTGSVAGSFGAFIACCQRDPDKDTVLFIDPGFPIQKSQLRVLGYHWEQFDIHDHRGEGLRAKMSQYLDTGRIAAIIYSNPNNPAWISLTESELQTIGELATQHDAIVLEDLAYFGMDFRTDFGQPFTPPFIPTVARYTDNYILMLSASKIFSYAGQRAAFIAVSDTLYNRRFPALASHYAGSGVFGPTLIASILYMITSGATHSTQFGYAAMLRAASDGTLDFVAETREYARRARRMKEIFESHGFRVVYSTDLDRPIADGFFFTVGYGAMTCGELMSELLLYGISSIALSTTGSVQQGVRACSSRMTDDRFATLDERLRAFRKDHKSNAVLETGRLILRPWREDDADSLYEYAKDPLVGPIAGWPVHTSVENSREIICDILSAEGSYAVTIKPGDEAVGSAGLMVGAASNLGLPDNEAEIGYWIGVPFWDRGYITEAARELIRHAFEDLGVTTLWCGWFDGNDRSQRVGEKCGFRHQRSEERHWPLIDKTVTQHISRLTREEWEKLSTPTI